MPCVCGNFKGVNTLVHQAAKEKWPPVMELPLRAPKLHAGTHGKTTALPFLACGMLGNWLPYTTKWTQHKVSSSVTNSGLDDVNCQVRSRAAAISILSASGSTARLAS